MSDTGLKIFIILSSTRQGRVGDKIGKWILEEAQKRKDITFELIDLRDWPLPFFDEPMSPAASGGNYTNPLARKWADKIGEADGFIFVTCEYNNGYSAVLKNALDYVYKEWTKKPVAFVSYGGASSGIRSVQQLRQIVIELQMVPLREAVYIQFVRKYIDEDGNFQPQEIQGVDAMLDSLIWWTKTLKTPRENS